MKAKEFLRQIQKIDIEIMLLEREIRDMYSPISAVRFDNVPGVPDLDATLHIVERIDVLRNKYNARVDELMKRRDEVVSVILRMKNANAEAVIYYRYVDSMSFGAIARAMTYSKERIFQLHREGLNEVDSILSSLQ